MDKNSTIMIKPLIIACDGEAASGKSTGAKIISKKYKLLLINSGLLYRYASKIIIENKPKKIIPFLKKEFKKTTYNKISNQKLFSQQISENVGYLSKKKAVRDIINKIQRDLIKNNSRICVEGRDIASNILKKNPMYDVAFYFTCNINTASKRRWLDLKKKVSLIEVKKSLKLRTLLDKSRTNNPLKKVKDAILIKSDKLSKLDVIKKMSYEIEKRLKLK